ncbi:MAG TPA: DUF4367 domain-containing protein [Candidatus Saccharimonadales bacterium]|nr:DUF4367 domain-containing protein [Candidatus Saccharimonadales bacterium]
MSKTNIIELNGKRYDALTGNLLGEGTAVAARGHGAPAGHRGRFIDGFVKTPKNLSTNNTQQLAQPVRHAPFIPVSPVPAKKAAHAPKHTPNHVTAHQPEHAKTLMRTVVKKPSNKPALKIHTPTEMAAAPVSALVPKLSVSKVDPDRSARAQDIKKSEAVKKFSPSQQQRPALQRAAITVTPVRARVTTPVPAHRAAPVQMSTPATAAPRPATPAKPADIFEAAIAHATSHEQQPPAHFSKKRRARKRLVNVMAGFAAALVIAGFIGYLNAPNIELRVASVRAGFHATLPSYQPVGYAMTRSVQTHGNQIAVSFHSDNGSGFKLTQQASNWDSATLYDNIVATNNKQHQTIENNGRTIYLYDGTNAAWVNAGVLYQITGNAELSNDQISQLAASM